MMACFEGVVVGSFVLFFPNIISHKLLMGFLFPFKMVFPLNIIFTISFLKIAVQTASHNWAMEIRDDDVRCGKIRANLADSGNSGIGR